jgi:hypothetical protein
MGVAGVSISTGRTVNLKMNNEKIISQFLYDPSNFQAQATAVYSATVAANKVLNNNSFNVYMDLPADSFNNRIVVSFVEVTYPRLFNFAGISNFPFSLPANTAGNYIEIATANFSGSNPVIYDLTNQKRYVGIIAAGVIKFKLQGSSADRNLVLTNEDPTSNIKAVTNFTQRNFTNYSLAANQGNYLIVSHSSLGFQSGGAVAAFRDYRSSALGGSYAAKIYDIDELVDQFAFGIKKHPLSIKNFVRYAKQNFSGTNNPTHIFLIGKGVTYDEFRRHESDPYIDQLSLVPTFGWPASDALMVSPGIDPLPSVFFGRLSVVNQQEINLYLDKVKSYEVQKANTSQTLADKLWMKQLVHVAGSNDPGIEPLLINYLDGYEKIIQKPVFGGTVDNFNTRIYAGGGATPAATSHLKSLFKSGMALLTYFGHSAATKLDYEMDDPYAYDNQDKYPMFLLNGCNAGNFFDYDVTRLNLLSSFSEKFVLAQNRGAIGVIASSHFGITNLLDAFSTGFYNSLITETGYNNTVGKNINDGLLTLSQYSFNSLTVRMHAEQFMLHGDPAVKIYASTKPDFVVEPQTVSISPSLITVADTKFNLKAKFYNIGKAVTDSVSVLIKWQHGNGLIDTIANQKLKLVYADSIVRDLVIVPTRDGGNNKIMVTIDNRSEYVELSETNNSVDKDFVIFTDNARPVYPYNFSIINKPTSKLFASTANPLPQVVAKNYEMQIDTTELFNSAIKITKTLSSFGGLLEFDPGITYKDSTVYYWRVAAVPTSGIYVWSTSSFVYLNGTETGFNQSHLYQHFKSDMQRIVLDSTLRKWNYDKVLNNISVTQSVYPFVNEETHFSISVNGQVGPKSICLGGGNVTFVVYDPVTLKPWYNQRPQPDIVQSGTSGGYMGSYGTVCNSSRAWNFEFSYNTAASRQLMANFMDAIPNGYIVVARLFIEADSPNPDPYNPTYNNVPYAATWATDPGTNNLYNKLKAAGFTDLDQYNHGRVWAFIYKKNSTDFAPKWAFSPNANSVSDVANLTAVVESKDTLGYVVSPTFGPSSSWKQLKWRGSSLETIPGDIPTVDVIGVNNAGVETVLYTDLNLTQQDFNISSINANTYPFIKLKMKNYDKANLTPYQLRYWRLIGDMVPEGAIASNIKYAFKDSIEVGEKLNFTIAFKNVGDVAFSKDSIAVKLQVIDRNNVTNTIAVPRIKKPPVGDSTTFNVSIDTKSFSGTNTMFADINPDNDQPEQFHFNNFLYKNFYVNGDKTNPLVDVTFDGVHILNGDIISAKPVIHVKLKDESKFLALNDTAGIYLQLHYPDGNVRRFNYNNNSDTLRFTPANLSNGDNSATVDFTPTLTLDGEYELTVKGKDRSENTAGSQDYRVTFNIYNQPAISEVFNYPNPFTTSTAFVFTLTGSQLPSNIRIQILTVTGKVVREINKDELGPIRIGRNITEFKWDGTDQYGSKLGNGVYLYRVVTNLNGNSLDKFELSDKSSGKIDVSKYFKGGYGKMYLMR